MHSLTNAWLTHVLACLVSVSLVFTGLFPKSAMANEACQQVESLTILLGKWQHKTANQEVRESWHLNGAGELVGQGEFVTLKNGNEKTSTEQLSILSKDNQIFYIAKPQSSKSPTAFKLVECTAVSWLFVNEKHDFPQKIHYQFSLPNQLKVDVTDLNNKGFSLNYKKQPDQSLPSQER